MAPNSLKGKLEKEVHVGEAGIFLLPGYLVAPSDLLVKVAPGTTPRAWLGDNVATEGTPFCHHVLPSPLVATHFLFQFPWLSRESVETTFSRCQGLYQLGSSIIIQNRTALHSQSYFILFKQVKNILILHLYH